LANSPFSINIYLFEYDDDKGKGPLSTLFPDENNMDVVERVSKEIEITKKEEEMGGAWAQLEASLLSSEIGEEEE